MDLERFPTSASAKRMIGTVSEEFYAKSYVAKWLYQVMGLEWDAVWEIIDTIPEQAFVETATWGLMYHEMKWGLPVRENLDYETRRRIIYEKRDVKKPMNPWAMEQIVTDLCGRGASVRDSNDDPEIPTNTFILQIESGETPVDLSAIIRKIRSAKQSHVDFSIRVCARTALVLNTRRTPWKKLFALAGTVPKTSRGLALLGRLIELSASREASRKNFPMAGNSGEAGLYPKTSRRALYHQAGIRVAAEGEDYANSYPMTGDGLKAGTKPQTSRTLRLSEAGLSVRGKTESGGKEAPLAGTAPDVSRRVAFQGAGMEVSADTGSQSVRHTLTGVTPTVSRRASERMAALGVSADADEIEVRYAVAGDGRQTGTAPLQSREAALTPDGLTVEAGSDAIETASVIAGQGNGVPVPYDESASGTGVSVTTAAYGARAKFCGSGFGL